MTMATPQQTFHFREDFEDPQDVDWILAAFDGALPHLAAKGSGQQWGSRPFSQRDGARDRVAGWLKADAQSSRASGGQQSTESNKEPSSKLFIAEAELPDDVQVEDDAWKVRTDAASGGKRFLSVAAGGVRSGGWWPTYFQQFEHTKQLIHDAEAEDPNVMYLEVLISDFRTPGSYRKGSGKALVAKIKDFYKSVGFVPVAEFVDERHEEDDWPGTVLKMYL
ncbi:hypothetical protein E8E14_003372 [Neopestalotiopsis sp. 37M]|nr:hypothetical protein E8E14_003372 [Neopestalotiopsis sp. 37M]